MALEILKIIDFLMDRSGDRDTTRTSTTASVGNIYKGRVLRVLPGMQAAFVNIGLVPDGGASWMLPRLVGKARATEMMMLGEKISGEKAADWGMIYKCVEDEALQTEARALATRLANGPTVAYAVTRKNILTALENSYAEQLLAEAEGQRIAGSSTDAAEGSKAFVEKRKAAFTGQ